MNELLQTYRQNFLIGNGIFDLLTVCLLPSQHDLVRYNYPWVRFIVFLCGLTRIWIANNIQRLQYARWTYALEAVIALKSNKTKELGIMYYLLSLLF